MASQSVAPVRNLDEAEYPFILTTSICEHTYRGFSISAWVDGAKVLFAEATVEMNPQDAERAGISQGDEVSVISPVFGITLKASILSSQEKGSLHISLSHGESVGADPYPAKIVKSNA